MFKGWQRTHTLRQFCPRLLPKPDGFGQKQHDTVKQMEKKKLTNAHECMVNNVPGKK